jgi:HAD superfamily hydrolase (TIGR01549 family)
MVKVMIFDLDGTLVDTEKLKAISYARAAVQLSPNGLSEMAVLAAFQEVVGLSRREVAIYLLERFGLVEAAAARMGYFGVDAPWQAFIQVRLPIYEEILAEPQALTSNLLPHNVAWVHEARRGYQFKVGLATMSYCPQVRRVLETLSLNDAFDFVASRDDVEYGKPDPEIYRLVACELAVEPEECLVIEDSPAGVKAAVAAGMHCVAVTTALTRTAMRAQPLLPDAHIVDEPDHLSTAIQGILNSMG